MLAVSWLDTMNYCQTYRSSVLNEPLRPDDNGSGFRAVVRRLTNLA